ncbi:hypothetical protein FF38_02043 [Lucilia cuprina]|uniref:Kazal-like domain-containing protein n=1 Tax=Lucilia cuprina TaxID=7375 RepID=A0A0L0BYC6_LUCCU|nr:hypothetical protein CVS40_9976 [Lucilia cuprina]KNC24279.1 hypothetical protein FF38_02043 [Lucilia cuprina]
MLSLTRGIIFLLFALLYGVMADDPSNCVKFCPFDFKPICATIVNPEGSTLDCTFPNDCFLDIFTCAYGKKEMEQKPEICPAPPSECYDIVLGILTMLA